MLTTKNEILNNILEARENRASLRLDLSKSGINTISLSLNIPGFPKTDALISSFFNQILNDLKIYLEANRIEISTKDEINRIDEAGDFYLSYITNQSFDIRSIKELCESFEGNHSLGRLIDIDIFGVNGEPISSGKEKLCYYCEKHSAIYCMRNNRHSYSEIRKKITSEISTYLDGIKKDFLIHKLSSLALRAILYEVSLSPKPGLVDFDSSGSHTDMNYFTFLNSSSTITEYFRKFCLLGYNFDGNFEEVLPKIRNIGLRAEKKMFEVTNNTNTQKGIIFLFGVCLFSASKLFSENKKYTDKKFQKITKNVAQNIVKNELANKNNKVKTHGEKVFDKFGIVGAGARYEVETGFQTVFNTALPYLNKKLNLFNKPDQKEIQKILQNGLLKIMAKNNDSNILHRSGIESLNYVKKTAKKALENRTELNKLYDFCSKKNISPGGSADLLAISLFLHFVKTEIE